MRVSWRCHLHSPLSLVTGLSGRLVGSLTDVIPRFIPRMMWNVVVT